MERGTAKGAWLSRAVGVAVAGYSSSALACPVCFAAKSEAQRQAFFDTTIFLTLLPVAMICGIAYWLFKRSVAIAAEEAAEARGTGEREVEVEVAASQTVAPARVAASSR